MPMYAYTSTCGLATALARPVAERSDPSRCPDCDGLLRRDFGAELRTITIAQTPLNFYTQWYDVYSESPREMAKRKGVERYDPSMSHKPEIPRTHLDVPRGIEDVDTLVKAIAPVDGQRETDKMLARLAPVEGEKAYS